MREVPLTGAFLFLLYYRHMGDKKQRRSFIDRAEESALEHIPEKYQKSVVGVYRFGRHLNIIGIIGSIFAAFAVLSCLFLADRLDINALIASLIVLATTFGMSVLGTRYRRYKMAPPSAFGWAIFVGVVCFVITGFCGLITIASIITNLASIYGPAMMVIILCFYAAIAIMSLIIAIDAAYYLFIAHKKYLEWHAGYSRRNHLIKKTAATKKSASASDDSGDYDDGL